MSSEDEPIMLALNEIINKTPNGTQKDYKKGMAIILMLKRLKIKDLMKKQIKATQIWTSYITGEKKK